jgi:DNA uptake protein ComE-like DNA-binding protein
MSIPHQKSMQVPKMCPLWIIALACLFAGITACTNNNGNNPDEIRRRTAEATETMRRDTKAVVEGVKDGMGRDSKAVNINKASREDLLNLPGMTEHDADRIIADRPYDNADDLVRRRIIPESEYDKIRDRVIAEH